MLTPAMRASSTSAPAVIMPNAVSTQVLLPPFLKRLPLEEETTTGLTPFDVIIVGACANRAFGMEAPATPAAVAVRTKSRRFNFLVILFSSTCQTHPVRPVQSTAL